MRNKGVLLRSSPWSEHVVQDFECNILWRDIRGEEILLPCPAYLHRWLLITYPPPPPLACRRLLQQRTLQRIFLLPDELNHTFHGEIWTPSKPFSLGSSLLALGSYRVSLCLMISDSLYKWSLFSIFWLKPDCYTMFSWLLCYLQPKACQLTWCNT